jgi:hypothetical protein
MTATTRFSILMCLVAACGGAGGDDSGDDAPGADAALNEPSINGMPASQFYGQFAYQTTNTGVEGAVAFPETADGRNAFLATFFLMPNAKLELFYAEGEGDVSATGWSLSTYAGTQKKREGTWRVDGAHLVLDSFMRCDGFELNTKPALRCTLTSTIVTAAAVNRSGTFKQRLGASSPDSSEFADYVP